MNNVAAEAGTIAAEATGVCSRQISVRSSLDFLMAASAEPMWPYMESGICSLKDLVVQVAALFFAFLRTMVFLLTCVLKMGTGVMPALLSLFSSILEFHRTQLTIMDIIFEIIFVSLMLVLVIYNQRILDYIWHVEAKLERTGKEATKKAMKVAPHALFFTTALICSIMGRKFFRPLSKEKVLPIFSLVVPVVRTVYGALLMPTDPQQRSLGASSSVSIGRKKADERALMEMEPADLEQVAASGRRTILLWIVLALYHSIATFLNHTPFVGGLLHHLPFLREMMLLVLVWAQLSPVFTEIVYEAATPLLTKASACIPSSSAEEERGLLILKALKTASLINESTEYFFRALCVESTSFLLIIAFCFVPSPRNVLSVVGLVTISLLLPAIRAAAVVSQWEVKEEKKKPETASSAASRKGKTSSGTSIADRGKDMLAQLQRSLSLGDTAAVAAAAAADTDNADADDSASPQRRDCVFNVGVFTTSRKIRKANATTSALILRQKRWLEYFTCIAIVWLLRCYGFYLWPSVGMFLAWYLSHSLWAGARPWSRYLVKLARLGMVMLTPIILIRMAKKMWSIVGGGSGTASTPTKHKAASSSSTSRGIKSNTAATATGKEGVGTPLAGGADSSSSSSSSSSSLDAGSNTSMSPSRVRGEVESDYGDSPEGTSPSLSTPSLRGHRVSAIHTGESSANTSAGSTVSRGRTISDSGGSEEHKGDGKPSRRRVNSKTRR